MTSADFSSLALRVAIALFAVFLAVVIIRLARNRLRPRHPLIAAIVSLATLVVLPALVLGNFGIRISLFWFLLPAAVVPAYLTVQNDPFATGSLLRALALVCATLGLLSLLRPDMLTAVVAFGIAGVMLYLADTGRRAGE